MTDRWAERIFEIHVRIGRAESEFDFCGVTRHIDIVPVKNPYGISHEAVAIGVHALVQGFAFSRQQTEFAVGAAWLCKHKLVSGFLDIGPTEDVARKFHSCHSPATGVGGAHCRYEIAERIDCETRSPCLFVQPEFHRLDHVRVASDDQLYTQIAQIFREAFLSAVGQQFVFFAPVDADGYQFGTLLTGFFYVRSNQLAVYVVNLYVRGLVDAVCSIGIVQESDFEAVDDMDHGQYRVAVGSVAVDSEMGHAFFLKGADGASHSTVAAVEDVVVGRASACSASTSTVST